MSASGFEFDQVEASPEDDLELYVDPLAECPRLVLCNPSTADEWIVADADVAVFLEEMR